MKSEIFPDNKIPTFQWHVADTLRQLSALGEMYLPTEYKEQTNYFFRFREWTKF